MTDVTEQYCYLNGEILPVSKATVGVYDIGLLRGFGIYEAMATANRKPFMFADHMERFRRSTDEVHLKIPVSDDEILTAIQTLIAKNVTGDGEAIIRFILTGGTAIGGIEYDYNAPTFYILVEPMVPLDATYYTDGCSLTVSEHQRQFPQSKTTNYIQAVTLQESRKAAGALEILYVSQNKVLECATSNFFIVKNGIIITPKDNILFGITRKVTMSVAQPLFTVEEREITLEELYNADEAFLTSSFKDVVPVVKVGERLIGDGKVGTVTKKVIELFHDFVKKY